MQALERDKMEGAEGLPWRRRRLLFLEKLLFSIDIFKNVCIIIKDACNPCYCGSAGRAAHS